MGKKYRDCMMHLTCLYALVRKREKIAHIKGEKEKSK